MSDHLDSVEEPNTEEMAAIKALLSRPDLWDELPVGLEDSVVAAISAEAGTIVSLADHRAQRRARGGIPWWASVAAAAVVVVLAGIAIATRGSDESQSAVALVDLFGTNLAVDATASAEVSATPAGLKILLDTDRLAGAPDGFMYEAWLGNGTIRVSAGTFHLRGGDGPIELWAGVDDPAFTILSVTLEPIDGVAESSGQAVLRGEIP